jgi:IS5 family transposase
VLDEHNTSRDVYADKGYPSARRSEMLQVLGWREHIQRKAQKSKPLSACQKKRNTRIARIRARVEHPLPKCATWAASSFAPSARCALRWP